jgi:putative heme iron utilization protein
MLIRRPALHLRNLARRVKDVITNTPEGHEDSESLPKVLQIINDLIDLCDAATSSATDQHSNVNVVNLRKYGNNLIWKNTPELVRGAFS